MLFSYYHSAFRFCILSAQGPALANVKHEKMPEKTAALFHVRTSEHRQNRPKSLRLDNDMIWYTIAIAAGLGADAMSVCAAIGVRWHGARQKFRMAWHMGLFQFFMPLLGWMGGSQLAGLVQTFGTYLAAGLVFAIGLKMLIEAVKNHPGAVVESTEHAVEHELHIKAKDPTRGWSLVVLSVATSIDALVVGFSLGVRGHEIWQASAVIGLVAALMALVGVIIGQYAGKAFGRYAETAGAVVLMALGIAFLWL